MAKETGGPAFPENLAVTPMGDTYSGEAGMTLRDYFAAKALPAMISMCQYADGQWDHDTVAQNAYSLADAMLTERSEP